MGDGNGDCERGMGNGKWEMCDVRRESGQGPEGGRRGGPWWVLSREGMGKGMACCRVQAVQHCCGPWEVVFLSEAA